MMLLMGSVYSYGVFRLEIESVYGVGTFLSGVPYMTSLFFYAFAMMVAGRWLTSSRLAFFVFVGTLLIIAGWMISAWSDDFIWLIVGYGGFIGTGVGMVYGVPVYWIQNAYPRHRGWMTGVVLMGFGLSPLFSAPFASARLSQVGLSETFLIFGLLFLLTQLPLALLFVRRSQADSPQAVIRPTPRSTASDGRKVPFWRLYGLFALATTIGLMMIGLSYRIGVAQYGFDGADVTRSISFFAVLNGLARPLFGRMMDRYGFRRSAWLSLGLIALAAGIGVLNQGRHLILYVGAFGLFWFSLGSWLAMLPAVVREYYGFELYARKYGVMFTAYGIGAIVGTIVSGTILERFGGTTLLYGVILGMVLLGAVVVWRLPLGGSQATQN
jgi:MFS family permease